MKRAETQGWVRIERQFDAPVDLVWRMWADPALFRQWYGPRGMTAPVAEWELRVGAVRRVSMRLKMPEG